MTDLSDAIANLCNPIIEHIPQQDDDGKWLRTHTVTHPPLLQQLEDAITSAFGGKGSGGGNSAGDVLNGAALYRATIISSAIQSWCRIVKVEVTKNMVADLLRWHAKFAGLGEVDGFYVHQVLGWGTQISDLLDPPKRLEITAPCSICGASKYTDEEGHALPFPVVVEYRREKPLEATGVCRACDFVWTGERELRQLRWELDAQAG